MENQGRRDLPPTHRRYTQHDKDQAVRLVRQLRQELGTKHGTVQRIAGQLGSMWFMRSLLAVRKFQQALMASNCNRCEARFREVTRSNDPDMCLEAVRP
jgi:hypothetical protein